MRVQEARAAARLGACPLCGGAPAVPFLTRAAVPVAQNQPAATADAARAMPRGRLDMIACPGCGFVFNRAFDPGLLSYGPGYDNTQALSPRFAAHLDALARHLVERCGVRGARIVEIGCGRGDFLRRLVAWPGAGNTGLGLDPAHAGPETAEAGRLRFARRRFGEADEDARADVILCRHVIEHLPDPLGFLRALRAALAGTPGARLFFETPSVAWTLRRRVLWDFFYEHCSLFTEASLARAFAQAGFAVRTVRHVFAGQYLWLEAAPAEPTTGVGDAGGDAGAVAALAAACGAAERAARDRWPARLAALAARGPVAAWGAGAKGVTFAALADPEATRGLVLADINPAKQGRFVPGTGHPILAPEALAARGVRQVLLMNPAYRAEVAARLDASGGTRLVRWNMPA
jgi:SAM-dependent methyltransferase